MLVYVQDKGGKPLMPTARLGKVRHWLHEGQAELVRHEPFTIRLLVVDCGYIQPLTCGVDVGTMRVGVSVVGEHAEVFSAEVGLRTAICDLLSQRAMFRRSRRGQKTPYREPRFLHRIHTDELAPSIRAKVDETLKVLDLVSTILPIAQWVLELGNFDPHKLKHPEVSSTDYQQGEQYGFANAREYVLWRDQHRCQACKSQARDPHLKVHAPFGSNPITKPRKEKRIPPPFENRGLLR